MSDAMDVTVLLGLVEPDGAAWSAKAAIVARLAQLKGGRWLDSPTAASWTGKTPAQCRRYLLDLEQRRVVLREGRVDRAKRFWCQVNPDWRRWRVAWAVPIADVAAQLAVAREERDALVLERFFARPMGARSVPLIARFYGARSWLAELEEDPVIARSGPRDNGAAPSTPEHRSRGLERAIAAAGSRAVERAITELGAKERGSTCGGGDDRPPPPRGAEEEEGAGVSISGEVKALAGRLRARCAPGRDQSAPWLRGKPLTRLAELVATHGVTDVAEAIDQVEAGVYPPPVAVEVVDEILLAAALLEQLRPPLASGVSQGEKLADSGNSPAYFDAAERPPPSDEERARALAAVRQLRSRRAVTPVGHNGADGGHQEATTG